MARRMRTPGESTYPVRTGSVALFTLITLICLAVLAVLSISTANATIRLAERRAQATTELYLNEAAAQGFVASLSDEVASGASLEDAANTAAEQEQTAEVAITTAVSDGVITASFDCGNRRGLEVALALGADGTPQVMSWRVTAVQNEEPAMGNLFGSM